MRISRTVIASALAIALIGLLAVGALALTDDGPGGGRGGLWNGGPGWHWGGWRDGGWGPDPERVLRVRGDLAADLAAQLNTSTEEVETAFRGVAEQRLQEAVDAGRIDQAAKDEALAAYDAGEIGPLLHIVKGGNQATTES
jgi:hypothetical protein